MQFIQIKVHISKYAELCIDKIWVNMQYMWYMCIAMWYIRIAMWYMHIAMHIAKYWCMANSSGHPPLI